MVCYFVTVWNNLSSFIIHHGVDEWLVHPTICGYLAVYLGNGLLSMSWLKETVIMQASQSILCEYNI